MAQPDEDPRELPVPEGPFEQRVVAFARDLAYGVKVGDWEPAFMVLKGPPGEKMVTRTSRNSTDITLTKHLKHKWTKPTDNPIRKVMGENLSLESVRPLASYLEAFGYFERVSTMRSNDPDFPEDIEITYLLTPKAMMLLEEPATPPSAFIAYSRQPSSPFALLIETRLKERGISAFIDRQIEAGEEWESLIQTTIQHQIDKFICIIAPGTLDSPFVQNEIRWALEANLELPVPIWHRGFNGTPQQLEGYDDVVKDFVMKKNAIRVLEESAQAYDTALSLLLNQLGYATGQGRLFD